MLVLTKILARLEALERQSMPPPARHSEAQNRPAPTPVTMRKTINAQETGNVSNLPDTTQPTEEERDFTTVTRKGRGKKDKTSPLQSNPTPTSYANVAASAANTKQQTAPPKAVTQLPRITEVTVLRAGREGHLDPHIEESIRARAADAIVREVRLKMSNAVAKPIPLRAGRWSAHPRSKGNFVYSFDGNVPFDLIKSYERILLAPFHNTGKLSPSMGWTRLLAHGVPVGEYGRPTGSEALLKEVQTMPGLKKAHFAMAPRWLKPAERIFTDYSTITFAISDPDGSIASTLLKGRAALFGKEVEIQRWVDKPALVQCSCCHSLGHIKTSRACPLGKDSVRCHICGGSHQSEEHHQKCPRKHAVAGICDCTHFKCINCHKTGHNAREPLCPARDLYRPRTKRRPRKNRGKGRDWDWAQGEPEAAPNDLLGEFAEDDDDDLYLYRALPPNPTGRQLRTSLHHRSIDNIYERFSNPMEVDREASGSGVGLDYDTTNYPEALNCPEPMETG